MKLSTLIKCLYILFISTNCHTVAKDNKSLIDTKTAIQTALNVIANRHFADTSKLKTMYVEYVKTISVLENTPNSSRSDVKETLVVKFGLKKGEEIDEDYILNIWEQIAVWLDNENDTSKAIISSEGPFTTGGKGYELRK